jgi:hypothetical protein
MAVTTINNEGAWINLLAIMPVLEMLTTVYSIAHSEESDLNTTKITTLRHYEVYCYLNSFTPYLVSNHHTHQFDANTGFNKPLVRSAMIHENQWQAEKSLNLFISLSYFLFYFSAEVKTVNYILCGYNVRVFYGLYIM